MNLNIEKVKNFLNFNSTKVKDIAPENKVEVKLPDLDAMKKHEESYRGVNNGIEVKSSVSLSEVAADVDPDKRDTILKSIEEDVTFENKSETEKAIDKIRQSQRKHLSEKFVEKDIWTGMG